MSEAFYSYREAFNAAVRKGREAIAAGRNPRGCEYGVAREGRDGPWIVSHLPFPENRSGWELRCEVVRPGDPFMSEGGAHE